MAKKIMLPYEQYKELTTGVMLRDKGRCRYPQCRSTRGISAHHVIFRSDNGSDISSNLCTLCTRCHNAVHGKISNFFLVILAADGNPDTVPNADEGLTFKRYSKVQRRVRWRV